ncbi:Nostrin [Camponotus japonicus]
MNEMRHVLTALRSPVKSSTLSTSTVGIATATWYDVPAPIIVHCREFHEEAARHDVAEDEESKKFCEKETKIGSIDENTKAGSFEKEIHTKDLGSSEKNANIESSKKDTTIARPSSFNEALYQNKETVLNDRNRKRHSTTVELNATTMVKTDVDGVPTISFSFLRVDEKFHNDGDEIVILEVDTSDRAENSPENQLYDLPKSAVQSRVSLKQSDDKQTSVESSPNLQVLYDVPKPAKDASLNRSQEVEAAMTRSNVSFEKRKQPRDQRKRSTRSLKSGRRSYGASDSDGYDAGIASMSGSYSDPECPNEEGSVSGGSDRSRRIKLQKRRLGKAWGRMRSWLREERTRIGEVVNRHARLQAVGALSPEVRGDATLPQTSKSKQRGFYDLTRARTQESGSITRVEEFGLSSVSEEVNVSDDAERPTSASPDSGKANSSRTLHSNLKRKTVSSDDILENSRTKLQSPVSFSMDKLCSDVENDETRTSPTTTAPEVGCETSRDHGGKGGLIKRRMLGSIRGLMASTHLLQTYEIEEGGQGGFEDVRRYIKQGGDFCKELASILHERAELEATYAKGLSKLSSKLTKACAKDQGNSNGGVNEAWRCVGEEMEAAAEAHRLWGIALSEQLAKPLRVGVAETQGRSRKTVENSVDKASKSLQEWRGIAAKSKKQSFASARENERLQDLARLQTISQSQQSNNKLSTHHMTEKEANKLETRRRKAEDSSRRADTEFYTVSVRAERARLEYENTVRKGAKQMELLEEERLSALKDFANVYLTHLQALAPRLQQSADRLLTPVRSCNVSQDLEILKNLVRRMDSNDATNAEQLLPDFYAEHVTLAMNRERRKQALVRVLHLIRQDLERERRGREGLETLHRAFIKTPAFAADESAQNVTDKLHHMRSMLLYLEAARYKVGRTLAEVEGSKRSKHPLSDHILVSRDKQGLQQSVLKIPSWAKNESFEIQDDDDELEIHLAKDQDAETRDWVDRTAGDGNSENPPDEDDFSDFDEFSSHSEDNNNQEAVDGAEVVTTPKTERAEQCRAIYQYSANLNDELSLSPGDLITVHQKQADGWWIGECGGRTGIFPATYVQVIH